MKFFVSLAVALSLQIVSAQDYTSYFTGNTTDKDTLAKGGICLMGGASEDDNAMAWFLERANQGDVLVLRASGTDGYNDYLYTTLGVTVNSVETIVFHNSNAADDSYVLDKIEKAEAIWFAGGDQWDYVTYWRNTAVDSVINANLLAKHLVVGGTSAGMAIQGQAYFTAENGTVTSNTALNDPYDMNVTVDTAEFIKHEILEGTITDTHYDNPDRKGRHLTFMARMLVDYDMYPYGIACEEYTAVCIDSNGIASVYGGHPTYEDYAYFIRINCGYYDIDPSPTNFQAGSPLSWNTNDNIITTYKVAGTSSGTNTFDLNDWETGNGGEWEYWWVTSGVFNSTSAPTPNCTSSYSELETNQLNIYPSPVNERLSISLEGVNSNPSKAIIYDLSGKEVQQIWLEADAVLEINVSNLKKGTYMIEIKLDSGEITQKFVKN